MARYLTLLMIVLVSPLAACYDQAPAYDQSVLTADESLVGTWTLELSDAEHKEDKPKVLSLEITSRPTLVSGGRLGRYGEPELRTKVKESNVPGYRLTVTVPEDQQGDRKVGPLTYDAVLLKVEDATIIAYQPAADRIPDVGMLDYVPVHRILRLERKGEEYRISVMKMPVVWIPMLRPLDDEPETAHLPSKEDGMSYLVSNPDRLVKVLVMAIKTPESWLEVATARRVAAKP